MKNVDADTQKNDALKALATQQTNWPPLQAELDSLPEAARQSWMDKHPHSAPASHVSGNVIDLLLTISPHKQVPSFDKALDWGKKHTIIEYFKWEGSHYHLVFF